MFESLRFLAKSCTRITVIEGFWCLRISLQQQILKSQRIRIRPNFYQKIVIFYLQWNLYLLILNLYILNSSTFGDLMLLKSVFKSCSLKKFYWRFLYSNFLLPWVTLLGWEYLLNSVCVLSKRFVQCFKFF